MKEKIRNWPKISSYIEIRVKRLWVNEFQLYELLISIDAIVKDAIQFMQQAKSLELWVMCSR